MKPKTEKPSDGVMRFFTPELYVRFNSNDDAVADAADEAWESASEAYLGRLAAIRNKLPPSAIALSELNLHDWELLSIDNRSVVTVKSGPSRRQWATAGIWLYEEVDLWPEVPGAAVQRIFWSNGSVTEIPFYSAVIRSFSLRGVAAREPAHGVGP